PSPACTPPARRNASATACRPSPPPHAGPGTSRSCSPPDRPQRRRRPRARPGAPASRPGARPAGRAAVTLRMHGRHSRETVRSLEYERRARRSVTLGGVGRERTAQLEYSEIQSAMLDEAKRRRKAAKIIAVLGHFLGREPGGDGKGVLDGMTVADIGCSAGFIADELVNAGASRTFGVDIDVPGLRRAAARFGDRVVFVCGDGTALPFPDKSVNVLVFNHIYEHVVDPDAVVKEMHRVLTDDGVLYLGLGNRLGV